MKRVSLHILHNHQDLIVDAKRRSQRSDSGMLQARNHPDFSKKPLHQFRARIYTRQQNFHRLDAVGELVADLENFPHPIPPQNRHDLVIANGCPDFKAHRQETHEAASIRRVVPAITEIPLRGHVSGGG